MFLHHLRKITAHTKLRNITVIKADIDSTVIIRFYDEVGDYLLEVPPDSLSQRSSRTGIQLCNLTDSFIECFFINIQLFYNLFPMLPGKFFITISDDAFFDIQYRSRIHPFFLLPADLYQQTFLKVTCSDTCRIEILQDAECFFQLLFRRFYTGINSQFITDTFQRFAEQAVIVQRADQVFHQFMLVFCQIAFTKLFFQYFVKRGRVGERNIFRLLVFRSVVLLQFVVGNIVFGEIITQRIVFVGIILHTLPGSVTIGIFICDILFFALLKCRVFKQFSMDTVFQFYCGKLQQFHD